MAGHMVARYLKDNDVYVDTTSRGIYSTYCLDVSNAQEDFSVINYYGEYDYVINCIGVLGPDADKNPATTILVNSWFPHFLVDVYKDTPTKVVHISTDCVFNGQLGFYSEYAVPNETNLYGRSKALGEIDNKKDVTFRTSIIGTEIKKFNRSGLIDWVINKAPPVMQGWENAYWNGITTLQLAKCIYRYMKTDKDISGIVHLVNNEVFTNKYNLLDLINEVFETGKTVEPIEGKNVNKILVNTREEFDWCIPDYRTQLMNLREYSKN
jgi:dTDP-4-dehydrorhamnose reductase